MEIWKKIPNFEDYEISNIGRIRSVTRRKGARSEVNGGIINGWIQEVRPKYLRHLVALRKNKTTYIKKVHRLVLEAFVGPCPVDMEALHINGDSLDNRIENLRWGTHADNVIDSIKHGTKTPPPIRWGKDHHNATLSTADVLAIRKHKFKRGDQAELARKYGVAPITISRIRKGISRTSE